MYKKFRLATILILVAITISLYVPVAWGDPGYPNAFGYIEQDSTALQARIETADPQIRDGHWSAVRIVGHTPFDATVECGWIKYANGNIYGFTQSKVAGGAPTGKLHGQQYPGQTHTYRIKRKGSGTGRWKYYIDDLSSPIDTRYAGFDVAKEVGCGGEAYSTLNAIGVSGCLDNQYRDLSKVWHYYMYRYTDVVYPYHIVPIPPYSWQVYGNN
jgi:hypothetical protein